MYAGGDGLIPAQSVDDGVRCGLAIISPYSVGNGLGLGFR